MTMDGEFDRDRVWHCLEIAGLKERVERMKNGLDTHMGKELYPDAVELSGGEKQKLVFARALYGMHPSWFWTSRRPRWTPLLKTECTCNIIGFPSIRLHFLFRIVFQVQSFATGLSWLAMGRF